MLSRMETLIGMSIGATDGLLGKVTDVYFDDRRWAARYLVVDTNDWLMGRQVLVSPMAVTHIDHASHTIHVKLTKAQVKDSPDIDTDKPVSRQHEVAFLDYYGYPDYFSGGLLWGTTPFPVFSGDTPARNASGIEQATAMDSHLRSLKEVTGYHLQASDEGIGHIEDFLLDDGTWAMRYAVVDTSNWWLGKHVVIPPEWIHSLDWEHRKVHVDVTRAQVKAAPEYDPTEELSREYEAELYGHYARDAYWT